MARVPGMLRFLRGGLLLLSLLGGARAAEAAEPSSAAWIEASRGVVGVKLLPPDPGARGSASSEDPGLYNFGAADEATKQEQQRSHHRTPSSVPTASSWDADTPNDQALYFRAHSAESPQPFKSVPYNDWEPFGSASTSKELTRSSIEESNKMIDQIERAQVAETKRSTFRALTRLRGAATAAYDGVARSQVGNIEQYGADHRFLDEHAVQHLADREGNVKKWAFPSPSQSAQPVSLSTKASHVGAVGFWSDFFDPSIPMQASPSS